MTQQAKATYSAKNWKRRPWSGEPSGEGVSFKLGRVEMVHVYAGDIEGEGTLEYMFAYNAAGEGSFVGLERVTGSIQGQSGTLYIAVFWHGTGRQNAAVAGRDSWIGHGRTQRFTRSGDDGM